MPESEFKYLTKEEMIKLPHAEQWDYVEKLVPHLVLEFTQQCRKYDDMESVGGFVELFKNYVEKFPIEEEVEAKKKED